MTGGAGGRHHNRADRRHQPRTWDRTTQPGPTPERPRSPGSGPAPVPDPIAPRPPLTSSSLLVAAACGVPGGPGGAGGRDRICEDADGVADERTVLITGWELGDTHGGVSNVRDGPDI